MLCITCNLKHVRGQAENGFQVFERVVVDVNAAHGSSSDYILQPEPSYVLSMSAESFPSKKKNSQSKGRL